MGWDDEIDDFRKRHDLDEDQDSKMKDLSQRMNTLKLLNKQKRAARKSEHKLVNPPMLPIHDEAYFKGVAWLNSLQWGGYLSEQKRIWYKWPRGKYNGRRIDGFRFSFSLHLLRWYWKPKMSWNFGEPYFIWFCFNLRVEANYAV